VIVFQDLDLTSGAVSVRCCWCEDVLFGSGGSGAGSLALGDLSSFGLSIFFAGGGTGMTCKPESAGRGVEAIDAGGGHISQPVGHAVQHVG